MRGSAGAGAEAGAGAGAARGPESRCRGAPGGRHSPGRSGDRGAESPAGTGRGKCGTLLPPGAPALRLRPAFPSGGRGAGVPRRCLPSLETPGAGRGPGHLWRVPWLARAPLTRGVGAGRRGLGAGSARSDQCAGSLLEMLGKRAWREGGERPAFRTGQRDPSSWGRAEAPPPLRGGGARGAEGVATHLEAPRPGGRRFELPTSCSPRFHSWKRERVIAQPVETQGKRARKHYGCAGRASLQNQLLRRLASFPRSVRQPLGVLSFQPFPLDLRVLGVPLPSMGPGRCICKSVNRY